MEITLENQTPTIGGQVVDEGESEQADYLYRERKFGRFTRQIGFPTRVEAESAEASLDNGSLRLRVPKAAETKPKDRDQARGEARGFQRITLKALVKPPRSPSTLPASQSHAD